MGIRPIKRKFSKLSHGKKPKQNLKKTQKRLAQNAKILKDISATD